MRAVKNKFRIFASETTKNERKMTTIIANPIYDSVFKFLLEDERVAKVLISALLQKEVEV